VYNSEAAPWFLEHVCTPVPELVYVSVGKLCHPWHRAELWLLLLSQSSYLSPNYDEPGENLNWLVWPVCPMGRYNNFGEGRLQVREGAATNVELHNTGQTFFSHWNKQGKGVAFLGGRQGTFTLSINFKKWHNTNTNIPKQTINNKLHIPVTVLHRNIFLFK
jgi:hypothetical protein